MGNEEEGVSWIWETTGRVGVKLDCRGIVLSFRTLTSAASPTLTRLNCPLGRWTLRLEPPPLAGVLPEDIFEEAPLLLLDLEAPPLVAWAAPAALLLLCLGEGGGVVRGWCCCRRPKTELEDSIAARAAAAAALLFWELGAAAAAGSIPVEAPAVTSWAGGSDEDSSCLKKRGGDDT